MSDQKQSTPQLAPQAWQEFAPFREAFLRYLTSPGDEDAFRRVGSLMFEMALDFCRHWPRPAEYETVSELRAIAGDLRYAEQQLRLNVAESVVTSDLDEPELLLALQGNGWAERLAAIAAEIEQGIAA
jgi:hypothetical protein